MKHKVRNIKFSKCGKLLKCKRINMKINVNINIINTNTNLNITMDVRAKGFSFHAFH